MSSCAPSSGRNLKGDTSSAPNGAASSFSNEPLEEWSYFLATAAEQAATDGGLGSDISGFGCSSLTKELSDGPLDPMIVNLLLSLGGGGATSKSSPPPSTVNATVLVDLAGDWAAATQQWTEQHDKQCYVQQERTEVERDVARRKHREERAKYEAKMATFHVEVAEEQQKALARQAQQEEQQRLQDEEEEAEHQAWVEKLHQNRKQTATPNSNNSTIVGMEKKNTRVGSSNSCAATARPRPASAKGTKTDPTVGVAQPHHQPSGPFAASSNSRAGAMGGGGVSAAVSGGITATPAVGVAELEEVPRSSLPSTAYIAYLSAVDKFYRGDYDESLRMLNVVVEECDGVLNTGGNGAGTSTNTNSALDSPRTGGGKLDTTPTTTCSNIISGCGGSSGCGSLFALYGNRSACYLNKGMYEHCLADCKRALRIHPTHYASYARSFHCSLALKRVADARQFLRQLDNLARHGYNIEFLDGLVEKLGLFLNCASKIGSSATTTSSAGGSGGQTPPSSSSSFVFPSQAPTSGGSGGTTTATSGGLPQEGALNAITDLLVAISDHEREQTLHLVSAAGGGSGGNSSASSSSNGASSITGIMQTAFRQRSKNLATPFILMKIECLATIPVTSSSSSSSGGGARRTPQDEALEEVNSLLKQLLGSAAAASDPGAGPIPGNHHGVGSKERGVHQAGSSFSSSSTDYADLLYWRAQLTYDRACDPPALLGIQSALLKCLGAAANNHHPRASTLLRLIKAIETQWSLSQTFTATKRNKEAASTFTTMLELDLRNNSKMAACFLLERAKCHQAAGNFSQALNDCNSAKDTNASDLAWTLGVRAEVQKSLGQLHYAVRDAEDSCKLNPTPAAHERLLSYKQELVAKQRQQQFQRDEEKRKETERANEKRARRQQAFEGGGDGGGNTSSRSKRNSPGSEYFDLSDDEENVGDDEEPFSDNNVFGRRQSFKAGETGSGGQQFKQPEGGPKPRRPQTAGARRQDSTGGGGGSGGTNNNNHHHHQSSSLPTVGRDGLYEVFGLKRDATVGQIQRSYRQGALKWHPDRWMNCGDPTQKHEAEEYFKTMNHAYTVLINEETRRKHDLTL